MRSPPARRLRAALAKASLRVRVMTVAAFLVMITSVVMGLLGTTLLHGYLLGRAGQQLRDFAAVGSRSLPGAWRPPRPPPAREPSQPFQFLIEIISSGGHVSAIEAPPHHAARPQTSAARLRDPGQPFTRPP